MERNNLKDKIQDVLIYEGTDYNDVPIRIYDSGQAYQSASFLSEEDKYELVFEYMKQFNRAIELKPDASSILLLGGAGYAYPKYVLSHYPRIKIDVVEIDPMAIETARQFFFLDDCFNEFGQDSFTNIVDDAKNYLENNTKQYDIIINDAFVELEPVFDLLTIQAITTAKQSLNKDGIYVFNLPGYKKLETTEYIKDVTKTLEQVFKYVLIFRAFNYKYLRSGNYIVLARDKYDQMHDMLELDNSQGIIITKDSIQEAKKKFYEFVNY